MRRPMQANERTELLHGGEFEGYGNSEVARNVRSASVGALGGSSSLGNFRIADDAKIGGMSRAYSVSADGSPSYLSPSQLGRQELYTQVPFTAVFGLQKLERTISGAFANYATEVDVSTQKGLSEEERNLRSSRARMVIMDEIEFDAQVVTTPLVFAISKYTIQKDFVIL